MAHHDAFDWLSLSAAYLGVLGLAGGVFRYWIQSRDRQRDQASRVFAWHGDNDAPGHITVRNLSDQPIFGIMLQVTDAHGERGLWSLGMLDAATDRRLASGGHKGSPIPSQVLGIKFRDASGRFWYRSPEGTLYRWSWWTRKLYKRSLRRDEKALEAKRAAESRDTPTVA